MSLEELFVCFVESGDETALERIFRRCSPELRRHARRLGHSDDDAEDLVQETMVTAVQRAADFDRERALLPWLKGILARKAAHLARDAARREQRARELARATRPEECGDPAEHPARLEIVALVEAALPALGEAYREPLRLHLLEGRSPVEIARHLGVPRPTVRTWLHRGMRQLRDALPQGLTLGMVLLAMRQATAQVGSGRVAVSRVGRRSWWAASSVLVALAVCATLAVASLRRDPSSSGGARSDVRVTDPSPTDAAPDPDRAPPDDRVATRSPAGPQLRVVDEHGLGVPAVGVQIAPLGLDPVLHAEQLVTDADGVVTLEGLAPAEHRIDLDRGPSRRFDPRDGTPLDLTLRAPAGVTVRGRVLLPDGSPAARAAVWLGGDRSGPWSGSDVTQAGDDGAFELRAVPVGAFLAARHPEWARSPVQRVPRDGSVTLRLGPRGAALRGIVRDHQGRPVADARVLVGESMDGALLALSDGAAGWRPPPMVLRTDADGRFQSAALEPGWHPVFVRAVGSAPAVRAIEVDRDVEIEFRLDPGRTVRGRIVGAAGIGLDAARVSLRSEADAAHVEIETGGDGVFRIDAVGRETVHLAARVEGFAPRARSVPAGGVDVEFVWQLDALPGVEGVVVLAGEGQPPVRAASLRFATSSRSALDGEPSLVHTDAHGRFRLAVPDSPAALLLRGAGEPLWRAVDGFVVRTTDGLRVELPADWFASATVAGRLTDADGEPIPAARLYAQPEGGIPLEVGSSGDDGRYRLEGLPPARYELFAESTLGSAPSFVLGSVDAPADEVRTLDARAPATGTVAFRLRRPDGRPVGDAVATLVGGSPRRRFALRMVAEGRQVLVPGYYELWVMGSRFRWVEGRPFRVVAHQTTELDVEVEPAVLRRLALDGLPAEAAAAGTTCEVTALDDGEVHGRFSLQDDALPTLGGTWPLGAYEVAVLRDGERWTGRFQVESLAPRFDQLRVPVRRAPDARAR